MRGFRWRQGPCGRLATWRLAAWFGLVPETGLEEIKVLKDENFQKLASEGLVWKFIVLWSPDSSKVGDFSWRQGLVWKKFRF